MKYWSNEKGNLTYTMMLLVLVVLFVPAVLALGTTQALSDRNSTGNMKANYFAQGAMESFLDYLYTCSTVSCPNNADYFKSWFVSRDYINPKTFVDPDGAAIELTYGAVQNGSGNVGSFTAGLVKVTVTAKVTMGSNTVQKAVSYTLTIPTGGNGGSTGSSVNSNPLVHTSSKPVSGTSEDNYTYDPNYETDFENLVNSFTYDSSNTYTDPAQLFAAMANVKNVPGQHVFEYNGDLTLTSGSYNFANTNGSFFVLYVSGKFEYGLTSNNREYFTMPGMIIVGENATVGQGSKDLNIDNLVVGGMLKVENSSGEGANQNYAYASGASVTMYDKYGTLNGADTVPTYIGKAGSSGWNPEHIMN